MDGKILIEGCNDVQFAEVMDHGKLQIGINPCPRCGKVHSEIVFRKLRNPRNNCTHFAPCPVTNQPIMGGVVLSGIEDFDKAVPAGTEDVSPSDLESALAERDAANVTIFELQAANDALRQKLADAVAEAELSMEQIKRLEAELEHVKRPWCCKIGCPNPATVRIQGPGGLDDYTESCDEHIDELTAAEPGYIITRLDPAGKDGE